MKSTESNLKPLLALAFGALCISFSPIFVKMIKVNVLGPTAIGFWRTFIGAVVLFIWAAMKGKSLKLPKQVMLFSMLAGLISFGDLFVWHRSIIYTGAGIATILGNTQVFWMALVGVVLFNEKLKPQYLIAVVVAFIGVVLLVGIGSIEEFSNQYVMGIVFGLMTGIFYSGYITSLKKAGHTEHPISFITLMAWTSLFCSMFLGGSMLIESDPFIPPDSYSWFILFCLAFTVQVLGWWVISTTLPKLKASQSGTVLLLQPIMSTVWGVLFFAEYLQPLQITGAVLTITAIYFGSVRNSKK